MTCFRQEARGASGMNLVLIGYRGTGKSTVARLLAERLGLALVRRRRARSNRGPASRSRRFLPTTAKRPFAIGKARSWPIWPPRDRAVLALGGGAVCGPRTARRSLRQGQRRVAARPRPRRLWRRIQQDQRDGRAASQSDRRRRHNRDHRYARRASAIYRQCAQHRGRYRRKDARGSGRRYPCADPKSEHR